MIAKPTFIRADTLHTYRVRAWQRAGTTRFCMAELVVKALNGLDAAKLAALDLGLDEVDWNNGCAQPPIVLRVEDFMRLSEAERKAS